MSEDHETKDDAPPADPDEAIRDLDVPLDTEDEVRGGREPTPGGPIPVPYPNVVPPIRP